MIVVEDTPAGVSSARGAGLNVLAVTNSHPEIDLPAASWHVESLESVTIEWLNALIV